MSSVRQLLKKTFSRCSLGARSHEGSHSGKTYGLALTTSECNDRARAIDYVAPLSSTSLNPSRAALGADGAEPRNRILSHELAAT